MEARDYIAALIDMGLSQAEIAKAIGLTQPTISKIARGAVKDIQSAEYRNLQALHADKTRAARRAAKTKAAA